MCQPHGPVRSIPTQPAIASFQRVDFINFRMSLPINQSRAGSLNHNKAMIVPIGGMTHVTS